jgi:hypothetical protein
MERAFVDRPRPIGSRFDLIGLDDSTQTWVVTHVEPTTIAGVDGWLQDARPVNDARPLRWAEKLWLYWAPWKPWCWWRQWRKPNR